MVKWTPRIAGSPQPEGWVEVAEPPVLGEPSVADLGSTAGESPSFPEVETVASNSDVDAAARAVPWRSV
jgi:hypothetical protein